MLNFWTKLIRVLNGQCALCGEYDGTPHDQECPRYKPLDLLKTWFDRQDPR